MIRIIFLLTFISSVSHADFHLKGFLGAQGFDPSSYNGQLAGNGIHRVYLAGLFGADAVFEIGKIGIGARYANSHIKVTGHTGIQGSTTLDVDNLSALLLMEIAGGKAGGFYFVGTYGKVQAAYVESENGGAKTKYTSRGQANFSLGGQGLLKLKHLLLFTELGYQKLEIDNLKNGSASANFKVDMEGLYYLLGAGISI